MISPEKTALLQAFLGSLPDHLAARLAEAVEIDRLMHGKILPHDMILDALRPSLRRVENPRRVLAPLRIVCRPFEDLLTSSPRTVKQKGRIARSSINPMWKWLSETVTPDATTAFVAQARDLIVAGRLDDAAACATAFAAEVAPAMRAALSGDENRKSARIALGGDLIMADVEEMALLLSCTNDIAALQRLLPRPVASLNDELLWSVRDVYDRLAATVPDAAAYVAVILMNRLARPWEALRLPMLVSRQTRDTLISSTDAGLAGELVFSDIDALSSAIRAVKHPNFDSAKLISDVARFAELSSAIVKELDVRRDGKWGQSLLKDRSDVGNVMNGLMERAPKEIGNALPMRKMGSFASTKVPDFSKPVAPEKVDIAMRYAHLVAGCRNFAAAASFAAKRKDAEDEMLVLLRGYNDDVVKELRVAEPSRRAVVEEQFGIAIELTAILFSEEEADFLRRRGRAAVADAAA
jgi:hypothetical protein